jgi:hypothetical protein
MRNLKQFKAKILHGVVISTMIDVDKCCTPTGSCAILCSHTGGYGELYLLGYSAV